MGQWKTAILTHTGCDISLSEAEKLGITVVPDWVNFNDCQYRNLVDLKPDEFYSQLKAMSKLPKTSHPSPGELIDAIIDAGKDADEVLCLAITSQMSGTYMTMCGCAKLLAEQGYAKKVTVFDTYQCSHGMGILVRHAAKLASEGKTASEIIRLLQKQIPSIGLYFVLDTLKYAKAGGRTGAITAFTVDKLNLKPLLVFKDGVVKNNEIARGYKDGLRRLLLRMEKEADFSKSLIVFHGGCIENAVALKTAILEKHPSAQITILAVGPVIGIYAGPGSVGVAYEKVIL